MTRRGCPAGRTCRPTLYRVLVEMRIRGLGVIDEAVLELSPGLTVLTGETGAGKTMVLTGLGLLLGGRADPGAVRRGAARALVEGRFAVPADSVTAAKAAAAGADLDDGDLLVSRTVSAEGRSRAHLGGRAVPAGLLGELADDLVAVHGQADQQRFRRTAAQREAVDAFAGADVADLRRRWSAAYARLREVTAAATEASDQSRERAREADMLRFGVGEVTAAALQPGEDTGLAAEEDRLAHAETLQSAAATARAALTGEPAAGGEEAADVLGLLAGARHTLAAAGAHDPQLADLGGRLADAGYQLADVASDLASYAAGIEADPARLAVVQQRRATVAALTRKYGDGVVGVLAWASAAQQRLDELDGDESRAGRLAAEEAALRAELAALAGPLTAARTAAGKRLAHAVTGELTGLAMAGAEVHVQVTPRQTPGPEGVDDIELLLEPYRGAPARPLHRGASGGELSRVMLAVEVVLAGADPMPTFVFDEVDAGVGGGAAVEVGQRLSRLARTAQVVVVTHLPQVAAFADRHLLVERSSDGRVVRSGVRELDRPARVRELTRMLAGLRDSVSGQAHAEELLAAAERASTAGMACRGRPRSPSPVAG